MQLQEASSQNIQVKEWLYRLLIYIFAPALFLLISRFGEENLIVGWLIFLAIYVALLSALGITNLSSKERHKKTVRPVVKILGIIVWSGFLAVAYLFLYMIIFDRENFFPQ